MKTLSFFLLLLTIPIASMAVAPPQSIESCVGDCSKLKQCPKDANEALKKVIADREAAKAANQKESAASNKSNLGKLGASQVNPMNTAKKATNDCENISKNCIAALNPIAARIEKIKSDIESALSRNSECNSSGQILNAQAEQTDSRLNQLHQVAVQEKGITAKEIANCSGAQSACLKLKDKNAQNENRMGDGSETASKEGEGEKKEQGGGGGGSPPGGGGGGAPPEQKPEEQKPEEKKIPVDCSKEENILKPECKTQKCNHPQYKLLDDCKVDCNLPANKNHAQCIKTVNPSSAKPK